MSAINTFLILLLVFMVSKSTNIRPRVFNGRDALKDEYPYVVVYVFYLRGMKYPSRACTASLISSTCVLTAAHCLKKDSLAWTLRNIDMDYIQFGDVTAPFNSTRSLRRRLRKVLKKVTHPNYVCELNDLQVYNDIGLAFIKTLATKTFGKLSAIDYTTLIGLPVVFAGYGRYSYTSKDPHKPLQVGEGIISYCPKCKDFHYRPSLCIAKKCNLEASYMSRGDSGGPLIIRNKIVGIHCGTSYGINVMTPVSIYLDWIKLNMVADDKQRRNKDSEE